MNWVVLVPNFLSYVQEWTDANLMWQPTKHGGITTLSVPAQKLWRPDIVLHNK